LQRVAKAHCRARQNHIHRNARLRSRRSVVMTFGMTTYHAASPAFQISGAVLFLTRSWPTFAPQPSGMHVVEIAATDVRLRGAIAYCPLVDGLAGTKNVPLARLLRLVSVGSLDKLGSLVGRPPIYITASAAPGEFGAIASEDAIAGLSLITPPEGTDWHNRVAARSLLGIGAHRPVRKAASIRCPILMIVAETDTIAPITER
jgi:hypothetical protein